MEFQIDCLLFLQLTDEALGQSRSELYTVAEDGVRAWKEGFGTVDMKARWGRSHIDSFFLEFASDARLDFPASASVVAAWKKKNTEFQFPDWFDDIVEVTDAAAAITALDRVSSENRTNHDHAVRRICHLKTRGAKAAELAPAEIAVNRYLALDAATTNIRCQVEAGFSDEPHIQERDNQMLLEIDSICWRLQRQGLHVSPAIVMDELKKVAGQKGSCVIEVVGKGVSYESSNGTVKVMDPDALKQRLRRRREKLVRAAKMGAKGTLKVR